MQHSREKLSIRFYKYFISYSVMLLFVLLLLGSILYGRLHDIVSTNAETVSVSILAEFRKNTESRLTEMERIALKIPLNTRLSPYALANDGYESYQMMHEIRSYVAGNTFIYDMALVYGYQEEVQVIGTSGTYKLEQFLQREYAFEQLDLDQLVNVAAVAKQPILLPVQLGATSERNIENYFLYITPLAGSYQEAPRMALFIISEQQFLGSIKRILQGYEGYSYILNEQNERLAFTTFGTVTKLDDNAMLEQLLEIPSTQQEWKWNKQQMSLIRLTSELNGWTYMLVMPKQQFLKETNELRQMFIITVLVIFGLGLLLAYLFARNHYRPWRKLATSIAGFHSNKELGHTDEYSYVSEAVGYLSSENERMTTRMKTRSRLLKEKYVYYLLHGDVRKMQELVQLLDTPQFLMTYPHYAIIVLSIDDQPNYLQLPRAQQQLLQFGLSNVWEELAEEVGSSYSMEVTANHDVIAVVNFDDVEQGYTLLKQQAHKMIAIYEQYFRKTITIAISEPFTGVHEAEHHWRQAEESVQYRYYWGDGQVIMYAAVVAFLQNEREMDVASLFEKLFVMLKQADEIEAEMIIRAISTLMKQSGVTPIAATKIWQQLLSHMIREMKSMNESLGIYCEEEVNRIVLEELRQLTDVEQAIIELCYHLADYIEYQRESKSFVLLEKLMQIVDQHYTDNTVALDSIAEQVALSPSYVTRYFKDQTGYSLIQYLDKRRMDEAKILLKTTNLKISEIIEQVGYVDEANFRRKFRKQEGMSPMQYRELSRGE
ncbi:helix-turn-helix domain-containing protein [Paenibacillus yanchengensis]|uniref:Helix-turn-helix domain-containing protein n=1 Tax=Paenibacillus yanchengensis TaxID=2035833 RepID=A0ABW4YJG5_9BACL